jgi:glycosyltransferase involved in cell wall biosynthesis
MHTKKKLLFFGTFGELTHSGNGTACMHLVKSGMLRDFEVTQINSSIRVSEILTGKVHWRVFRVIKRFYRLIESLLFNRPHVALVFCNNGLSFIEKGFYIIILKLFRVPSALFPRAGRIVTENESVWFKSFFSFVLNTSDVVISQGEYWKVYFEKFLKLGKSQIVQNWISDEAVNYLVKPRKMTQGNETIDLVFIGWLVEEKDLITLLEAVKYCLSKSLNVKLDIYGEGPLRSSIERYILENSLDRSISLCGWASKEHKAVVYRKQPILILPSIYEGMPNVILEGMAHGLPIIASNISTIPELIEHNKNGLLFEPKNAVELYENIALLGKNIELQNKFIINSKENSKRFSLDIQGQVIRDVLLRLA